MDCDEDCDKDCDNKDCDWVKYDGGGMSVQRQPDRLGTGDWNDDHTLSFQGELESAVDYRLETKNVRLWVVPANVSHF